MAIIREKDTKCLPLMVLASLLCMVAQKIIGVIQTPLQLHTHTHTLRSHSLAPQNTHTGLDIHVF